MQAFAIPDPTYTGPVPAAAQARTFNVGGVLSGGNAASVVADQQRAAQAKQAAQASMQPVVQGLAHHVRQCWSLAKTAKLDVERRMLRAVRSRRGEYDPDKLAQIREEGGSEIYMMLFSTKARQAQALLRDVMIGSGTEKPWSLRPTSKPEIDPATANQVAQEVLNAVAQAEMSGMPLQMEDVRQMLRDARVAIELRIQTEARDKCEAMESAMEDEHQEGGFHEALDQFLDDVTTFPTAVLKGPVMRRKPKLSWTPDGVGGYAMSVDYKIVKEWERVDPFNIYPAPWSRGVNDAWLFERHRMARTALEELIGVEGYSEDAIRKVLEEVGNGGLHEWLSIDTMKNDAEGRTNTVSAMQSDLIDALQFWGSVSGKMLLEWGMDKALVADPAKNYEAEVWLIGNHVIKAALNKDPICRRPYFATGYERVPGAFWHNSLFDIVEDCQDMCNAAARALANNLGIASGPQVVVTVDRLPAGAEVNNLYPWKIHQVTSDPMGSTARAIDFFQPSSNAAELMGVYEKFSSLADEVSGIPRYMTGGEASGGAGRTASGMSMMIGNASKTIRSIAANLDVNVLEPCLALQYCWNMRYSDDPALKGDVKVVARGARSLMTKDNAQVRRNEFLAATANPIDMQIVGLEGRAYILREAAKALDMDTDKIVPSESVLKMRAMAAQAMPPQGQPGAQPGQQPQSPSANGQELLNGAPVTDNFQPEGSM